MTLDHEEIDPERGKVIEEWRAGRGANQRMRDENFPVLVKGSKYAERLPIELTAQKYLNLESYVFLRLLPEKSGGC